MFPFLPTTSFNGTSTRRRQIANTVHTRAGSDSLIRLFNVSCARHGVPALPGIESLIREIESNWRLA